MSSGVLVMMHTAIFLTMELTVLVLTRLLSMVVMMTNNENIDHVENPRMVKQSLVINCSFLQTASPAANA